MKKINKLKKFEIMKKLKMIHQKFKIMKYMVFMERGKKTNKKIFIKNIMKKILV